MFSQWSTADSVVAGGPVPSAPAPVWLCGLGLFIPIWLDHERLPSLKMATPVERMIIPEHWGLGEHSLRYVAAHDSDATSSGRSSEPANKR